MSDIQRWDMFAEVGINEPVKYDMWEAVEGRYVLYADHVAAVAAAEAQGFHRGWKTAETYWRDVSIRYGRRKVREARDAVAAAKAEFIRITDATDDSWACRIYDDALAAIDALEKP